MLDQEREKIRAIKTFPSLVKYLRDELNWPIEIDHFEDLVFDYEPEELGIDPETAVKIDEIKQLRPLVSNQPWGIFFIKFEPKRLPVVVLRRILSRLVFKKRASANKSEHASWNLDDLLFISNYGEDEQRQITFAHFSQDKATGDLPTLKVLGWDDADTALHLDYCHQELKGKLHWPDDEYNLKDWCEKWSSAFILRHREVITTSKDLAMRLADLARRIRRRANRVLAIETERGHLRKLYRSFQEALIHDLSEDDFADMYAQTIAYGLLAARVSRPMGVTADNITDMIPITNPFLKEMLGTFLTAGGRKGAIDFDELGVQEVVELLNSPDTHMDAILRDFGNRTQQEDPVIHFYELFLSEYDKKKKIQRGIFYTPQPVVSYIVRSVHELLQSEFGLEDGLAAITTWDEMVKRTPDIKMPEGLSPDEPFVQILDPATGTATFLVEVIDLIYKTMRAKWMKQGYMALETQSLWNEYVAKHLLPRLYGFELMMAPYAIAHMKLGLKLFETGYAFNTDERVHVYLTNSLEPAIDSIPQRVFEQWAPALAHEARAVNIIKRNKHFTVVIGNPPYLGESANKSPWIHDLVNSKYQYIEGERVKEKGKKNWLLDDYIKFIRFSHYLTEPISVGLICLITNHSYLDNPTFRGMRYALLKDFTRLYLLDLHGNYNKGEKCPDGSDDENVFDIRQGVAISLLVKKYENGEAHEHECAVFTADIWGAREIDKYPTLRSSSFSTLPFEPLEIDNRFFFFKQHGLRDAMYDGWWSLRDIFKVSGNGIITAHDHFSIAFSSAELAKRLDVVVNSRLTDAEVLKQLELRENSMWDIRSAREALRSSRHRKLYVDVLYRPFDIRRSFFHKSVIFNLRLPVTKHIVHGGNTVLICSRMTKGEEFAHVLSSRTISEAILLSPNTSNNAFVFPLFLMSDNANTPSLFSNNRQIECNICQGFIEHFYKSVGIKLDIHKNTNKGLESSYHDLFNYIYCVLHSPIYRSRYSEALKVDFPHIPLTSSLELFRELSGLGEELVALHLMESPKLNAPITKWHGSTPSSEVEKVTYSDKTVWIDQGQTEGFRGVPDNVWNFHIGGYQVCEKWLKVRKGRVLSAEDITHYQKIAVALNETIRLMKEIDEVIEEHGGWPGAFVSEK